MMSTPRTGIAHLLVFEPCCPRNEPYTSTLLRKDIGRAVKIAVLVHNDVIRDTRVQKESATLAAAGHDVQIFGLGSREQQIYPREIDGARLEIVPLANLVRRTRDGTSLLSIAGEAFVGLCLLLLGGAVISGASLSLLATIVMLCAPLAIILINTSLPQHLRRRASAVWLAVVVAGGAVALRFGWISYATFVIAGLLAWLLFRLRVSARSLLPRIGPLRDHATAATRYVNYRAKAEILARRVEGMGDVDVVHCHDLIALMAGGRIKRRHPSIKLIWDAHEIYEALGTRPMQRLSRAIIKANARHVDAFITINNSIAEFYRRKYSLPPATVVMNATRWSGQAVDDGRLRAAAGLGPERRIALFQGGLTQGRGLSILRAALPLIPEPWTLVLMGWGKLEAEFRGLADQLDSGTLSRRLALLPPAPLDELQKWTAGGDIGLIPYENTTLNHLYCTPNKLWEFPNAGVPILATALDEMKEIITKAGTGYLLPIDFTARDVVEFFVNLDMADLARKKENCARFSQESNWATYEPALLQVYDFGRERKVPAPSVGGLETPAA